MRKTNRAALIKIGWIIRKMHAEASRRGAVVYRAEEATREAPFQILIFTMLSARTRDETTLKAVHRLFRVAETPSAMKALGKKRLEKLLYGVGFYRVKSRNLIALCKMLGSRGVPDTLGGLLALPGVGRKTANIVLARAFGKAALGVDVHVHRISNRIGLVSTRMPEKTERALTKSVPARHLRNLNRDFVAFGQTVCLPRKPLCGICPIRKLCWRVGAVDEKKRNPEIGKNRKMEIKITSC